MFKKKIKDNLSLTSKKQFFSLLKRAIQPLSSKVGKKEEYPKDDEYSDKQTRQRKTEDASDSHYDKFHE